MQRRLFKNIYYWVILAVGLGIISPLAAQTPSFKATHYNSENIGLSHNSVLNMMQDSQGFIWLSTMDGLNRFDGKSMKVFQHDPTDSTSISDSFIHGVLEISTGLLLIGTRNGGLNLLDPKTEQIKRITHKEGQEYGIPNSPVSVIFEDSKKTIWAGFFTGRLGVLDVEQKQFFPAGLRLDFSNQEISSTNSILELKDGSFLLTSLNGVYYISAKEVEKARTNPRASKPITTKRVLFSQKNPTPNSNNLYIDSENRAWVELLTGGLQRLDSGLLTEDVKRSIESGVAKYMGEKIILERDGKLIKGAGAGHIIIIDKETQASELVRIDVVNELAGAANLFEDNSGNLWFYSWGGGFHYLKEKKGIQLFNNENTEGDWAANFMLAFEESDQGLWIGTNNGLSILPVKGKEEVSIIYPMKEMSIWSLEKDDLGLWITTRTRGLFFISNEEIETKRFNPRNFTTENSLLLMDNVHQVFRDSRGWLWIGYQGEGFQAIKNVESWLDGNPAEVLTPLNENIDLREQGRSIRRISEDEGRNIWIATTNQGFLRLMFEDHQIKEIVMIQNSERADSKILHNDARNVYQQNDSTFWLATYGGGINKWVSSSNRVTNFSTPEGLANNSTYGILGDGNPDYIWISTNNGISRLNTEGETFTTYTESDNLQNNEFNTGAFLKRRNGDLVFGGVNGFNIIDVEELAVNGKSAPVYITQINLFNSPLELDSSVVAIENIRLSFDQNFLSFEFATLDYEQPLENEYAYKMDGVDNDWVYSGNRNFADYPNLSPGEYFLQVKAANSDGLWNEEGAMLNITIMPPWWATWWSRTLFVLLFVISFSLIIRYVSQRKLREQIRQMELKNKLRNERERISRDLHDHVGSQLANIISGLSLVDKYNEVEEKDKSNRLMKSLKGDAEVTIKQLRETIWALNQSDLTIAAFHEHIKSYFKNQSALNEILKVSILLEGDGSPSLSSPQALNIFRIIQEAAQNTLKYAEANRLTISLIHQEETFSIKIKDDGTFKKDNQRFNGGYGMKNMQKRAKEIDASVEVNTDSGTEVCISLKL